MLGIPKPLKKAKKPRKYLNRQGKSSFKVAKRKAWEAFSKFIRMRDAIKNNSRTHALCYTCGKEYPISGRGSIQAGHFISGRSNIVLFSEDQTHAQCYICNYAKKGNWAQYFKHMVEDYGLDTVRGMIDDKWDDIKLTQVEFEEIRKTYENKLKDL